MGVEWEVHCWRCSVSEARGSGATIGSARGEEAFRRPALCDGISQEDEEVRLQRVAALGSVGAAFKIRYNNPGLLNLSEAGVSSCHRQAVVEGVESCFGMIRKRIGWVGVDTNASIFASSSSERWKEREAASRGSAALHMGEGHLRGFVHLCRE